MASERADAVLPARAPVTERGSDEIRSWLIREMAGRTGLAAEQIDTGAPFVDYGIPSKEAAALSGLLETWLGRPVSPTVFWEYPTIDLLAEHLAGNDPEPARAPSPSREAAREPLALIGIGCRFPGAPSPPDFWRLLADGRDAISEVPQERWDIERLYDPNPATPGTVNTRWGGFVERIDRFDAPFFGITPREASRMDPQQRLLLEVAWEALEDAGQPSERVAGSKAGVFIGISTNDYGRRQFADPARIDAYAGTGNALSIAANRISYQLDLLGPSMAIDTACSSSLVAVHLACRSLWSGEATLALAGGTNLILAPDITINFTKAGVMAPDGRCKTFDARANGYVRGEGAALVVLKPLARALADGDRIYALILGSAVNSDGRTNGLMAPSRQAQEAVLRDAYASAGISPGLVQYVEAHGTGTFLGDPIEAKALGTVLAAGRPPHNRCAIGSVKTNIGHLEAAAGVAGLVKVALALKHGAIPPSLHFETPNPHIPFDDLPLRVQRALETWPAEGARRIAGVSSFGFGGTNAHVVLAEAPAPPPAEREAPPASGTHLLTLSARSPAALQSAVRTFRDFLAGGEAAGATLRDICYSAAVRRTHHEHRLAVPGRTREELVERLESCLAEEPHRSVARGRAAPGKQRPIIFVFPGQGSQWRGMGKQLLEDEPVFRAALEACDSALREHVDWSLVEALATGAETARENDIDVVQPTLFGIQVALAALWQSWGIEPAGVVGHSMGEVAAAYVAGALTLQDAARVIALRSRLLKTVSGRGAMAVVELPLDAAARAAETCGARVSVAVESSPTSTVLSGDAEALKALTGRLERQEVFCRLINVDVASHSSQMDPLLDELRALLRDVRPRLAAIPLHSTVSGEVSNGVELSADYWARNLREPVRFSSVVRRLLAEGCGEFLEVSAHPILVGAIRDNIRAAAADAVALASLQRGEDERGALLSTLGVLYTLGHPVRWDRLMPGGGKPVALPSYAWQRERCWFEAGDSEPSPAPAAQSTAERTAGRHPLLGPRVDTAHEPSTRLWEVELSQRSHPYLRDHLVRGRAVLPGTAYVEMALAAAAEVFGAGCTLADVEFTAALFLDPAQAACRLQLVLEESAGGPSAFRIYGRARGDAAQDAWTLHASGKIRLGSAAGDDAPRAVDVAALQAAGVEEIGAERYYAGLRASGLHYGPSFQAIERVWRTPDRALGLIRVPTAVAADAERYIVHPAVLDAAFQVVAGTVPQDFAAGDQYLPARVGALRVHGRPSGQLWSVASRTGAADGAGRVTRDVLLLDETGAVVVEARALELRRAGARAAAVDSWLYERRWEPQARSSEAQPLAAGRQRHWIVLADRGGVAQRLRELLERRGDSCVLVHPGKTYRAAGEAAFEIDPAEPAHARRLLDDARGPAGPACDGVVHLWNLDSADGAALDLAGLEEAQLLGCASVLHCVQALVSARTPAAPRLFVITRRAAAVDGDTVVSVAQSPVDGLARTIAHEHPELRCTRVDLADGDSAELESLHRELADAGDGEDQIALRGAARYVARFVHAPAEPAVRSMPRVFRLEVPEPGVIDQLTAAPLARRPPRAGEVEIEVAAAGVNFMDVMQTLGLVPSAELPLRPGAECCGRIAAVGTGVEGLRVGDEVVAIARGTFASFATAAAELVARKPERTSVEQAATLPVAFLTAYYALRHAARLRAGERVLIHAAAGGVGLAAVQIARRRKAEIFATAGSPEKRDYLRSLGVEHVFDSRSLAFGDEILERTRGEGVDVVLNSLSGDLAERSLALLRGGGRFLEIGKRDIHENRSLHLRPFAKGLGFFAIDLQQLCAERPRFVGEMLRRLMRRVEDGVFEPLPVRTFAMAEAAAALRFMAQAKHLGKIVLVPALAEPRGLPADAAGPLRADATYLITGGLGGLGLEVARWMAQHGAGHLALAGRGAASAAAEQAIAELRQAGARVSVFAADVAVAADVSDLLAAIAATPAPLRGIVHAAGVLDDGLLVQLDRGRLAAVARPKIAGAWNLHTATADTPLDFFVLFSSAAALIGSPGQANYAAANAFLDALARHRRAAGLPGLSIGWGPWGGVGLAAAQGRADRLALAGFGTIAPADGVAAFGRLLRSSRAQVAVIPIDWARLDARVRALRLLAQLVPAADGAAAPSAKPAAGGGARDALRRATPHERGALVRQFMQDQLARVTGLRASSIDLGRPLSSLGVDSLMALELKNRIERELEIALPIAALLQAPDAGQLAERLVEGFASDAAEPVADVPRADTLPPIVPDLGARHLPFPLNDIQGAYWVGRSASLELGGVGSHFYLEFERAELDVERLGAAWRRLIERHEMLRAVVGADGRQQILTAVPRYEVETLDVRGAPAEQAHAQVEALRERLAHRVYDASRWPLFAVCVTRLAEERVRVHVSIDLLMADVWSLFILFREWGWLYAEPERELAPLALSFRDYVLAEAALQGTPRYARARAYWTERLPKLRPGPELPLARLPAAVAEPRFVRRRGRVAAAAWSQVKARARQAGLTPSVVLCTAFAEVLAAWSKSAQFTLNVTLFHRLPLHPEINAVVGDFTSTVLLAVEGGGTASFVERARRLQQQLWEDLEHRYVSGVQVLRDLARLGGGGPRLGMPVVFTSTLGQEDTDAVTEWLGELVHGVSQTPQVWLDHQVGEERGALAFNWDAVEALFPEGLLAAMFAAYCGRLEQLAADAALWDAPAAPLVPAADRRLFDTVNATATAAPDVTLPALVAAQVAQRPEQVAVLAPARALRYSELGAASAAVASWLLRHGAQPNRLVAVVMEKGWEQIVAVLGVLQAGAAYLPIEADVPAERLALLLEQGEATLVLTQSWLEGALAWPPGRTLLAVDRLDPAESGAPPARASAAPRADDLAYVIFTSGSTGVPKGVMLTHRAVVNTLLDMNRRFAVGPADRVLALSALSFDLSVYDIFGTLAAGGTIVLPAAQARRDPAHWLERLAATRVTIWNSVPALLQLLVETAEASRAELPDSLRLVLLSGDWIPVGLPERIRARAPAVEVIGLGGATEAAIWSIAHPIDEVDPAWPSIPYGRPLANQTWHVLHDDGTPCPVWVPGELYIGGAGLAQGYWHDAERTAARFVAHPRTGERLYRTGDWGRYRPDGTLEFLGREDSQVKVHGYRIELGEIEAALVRQPGVERAVAVAHGERMGEKRLAAFVVARAPAPDAAALRAALQATLPAYMLPATIEIVPALPLTANGKVDRSALPLAGAQPPAAAHPGAASRAAAPRSERASVADRIERLVADALKVERVDREADLFALGLTSIDMMRLANELERTFGFRPKIGDLFKLTHVAAVASYYERLLEARRGEPGAAHGPPLGDRGAHDAFEKGERRLRPLAGPLPAVRLPRPAGAAGGAPPHDRRTRRTFAAEQVALADLAAWLECLAQNREEQGPKHRYGSAGGLYPVQAYLHARPGRIDGLGAGTYYYHPAEHALLPLTPNVDLDRAVHAAANRPVYDQAAFSLFLVAQMSAIEPVYGDKSRDFALLEAGLVTQLLEEAAARHRIGLCQIGLADFDAVRGRFLLEQSHVFLHAMIGGRVAPDAPAWEEGVL